MPLVDSIFLKILVKDNFKYLKIISGSLLVYLCLFYQLDSMDMADWDEARVAKSSYEMSENNNFIVVMYEGSPDFWSTKPSFMHIVQSLFIKCFGLSALSVRLPSAICGFLVCLLLYVLLEKIFKNKLLAFLAVLIFISAPAVVADNHSFRTADYDALLVLTLFTSSVFAFLFFEDPAKKKYIYFFFFFLLLAVLTKGIAGLFYLPGIALYALYKKRVLSTFKDKHFYFSFLGFIIPVIIYFLLHEKLSPGYLKVLNDNEILGRYYDRKALNDDEPFGDIWYYYNFMIKSRFNYFYFLVPCGLLGLFSKNTLQKNITVFATLLILTLFFIISFSTVKNYWYDLPLYPYLAILVSISIFYVYEFLSSLKFNSFITRFNFIPYLFLFIVFLFPYSNAVSLATEPLCTRDPGWGYYTVIQDYIKQKRVKNNSIFSLPDGVKLSQTQKFYIDVAKDNHINLQVKTAPYTAGDMVIAAHSAIQQEIENNYDFKLIEKYREINVYQIISKK